MEIKMIKLGNFSEMKYGKMPKKNRIKESGEFPIYSGYRITGYYDEYNLEEPTLVVVARGVGGTGDVKISPAKCYLTNLSISVSIDEKIALKEYLYYYFQINNLRYLDSGSAQSQITISDLGNVEVPIPRIDIQKKIVEVLKSFDNKIENNNQINRNLSEQATCIFKNQFLDYQTNNGVKPTDWRELYLEDVAILSAGGDKPKKVEDKSTEGCSVPIFSNGTSDEGLYGYTDEAKIKEESVTVSARGTIGYVCLRQEPYVPIVRLVSLIPKKNIMTAKFLYLYLESLHISGTGTTQQQLTVPTFKKTKIIVPPFDEIEKFTNLINPLYDIILQNKKQNNYLSKLRDTILPKLMSNELDISTLEI